MELPEIQRLEMDENWDHEVQPQLYMVFMTEPYQLFASSIDLEWAKQRARNIDGIVVAAPVVFNGRLEP